MEHTFSAMLRLIRVAMGQYDLTEEDRAALDQETLERVYDLSKFHDMTHLVAAGLKGAKVPLNGEVGGKFRKQLMAAVYSDETKVRALAQVGELFDGAGIPYLPLKGSILRDYYPEPWMRNRCDLDVLVHVEDLDRACAVLERAGYELGDRKGYDVSIQTPGGVHLELHYTLHGDKELIQLPFLKRVWDHAQPVQGQCWGMSDAMFYYYHMAHMAKHVHDGGCGVRPFLDLWVLDRMEGVDREAREDLIRQGELTKFTQTARSMARSWFDGEETQDPLCQQLENYVRKAGVYGNRANYLAGWEESSKGFFLRRVFNTYPVLKKKYPILETKPWLFPMYQVVRWRDILRPFHFKSGMDIYHGLQAVSSEHSERVGSLLDELELR